MANLDLEALGITTEKDGPKDIIPSDQTQNSQGINLNTLRISGGSDTESIVTREIISQGTNLDLDILGITLETRKEQTELRARVEQISSPEFSAINLEAFQEFMSEHSEEINQILLQIETAIQEASEMTLLELTEALQSITLKGDFAEVGNQIEADVVRILGLSDGEEITITRGEQDLIFESKEAALLYLYEEKIILYHINEFYSQLEANREIPVIVTDEAEGEAESLSALGYITYGILGILSMLAIRNTRRNYRIRGEARALETITVRGKTYTQEEITNMIRDILQGNSDRDTRIKALTKNINFWVGIRRFQNISRESVFRDIFIPTWDSTNNPNFYIRFQQQLVENIIDAHSQRQEVISHFKDTDAGGKDFLHAEAIIGLDHDIPNNEEYTRTQAIRALKKNIIDGNLSLIFRNNGNYPFNMDTQQIILEIRRMILEEAMGIRPDDSQIITILGDNRTTKGSADELLGHDVTNYSRLIDIDTYESMLAAREVRANLDGTNFDRNNTRRQLQEFFDSIGNTESSKHRYTYYSALAIIERILNGSSLEDALRDSMPPSGENGNNVRARITDTTYLDGKIDSYITTVIGDLNIRLNALRYADEIQAFQNQFIDPIVRNRSYLHGFEVFGRRAERIIEQRRNLGLLETGAIITPETGDADRILTPETPEESGLRAQPIFDENGNLTPDARTLFEGNLALYAMNGHEVNNNIINWALDQFRGMENIGQMLDFIERYNQENTIRNLEDARITLDNSLRYQAQDTIERAAISKTGSYGGLRDLEIRVDSGGNISYSFFINENQYTGESIPDIESLERQLITSLGIGDIPNSWAEITRLSYMRGIDVSHLNHVSFLRNIDTFFRRAR